MEIIKAAVLNFVKSKSFFFIRQLKISVEPVGFMESEKSQLYCILKIGKIDNVFDVGANTGQFGKMLRQLGYEGTIHSFEPVSSTFEQLTATAASDRDWHCHKMALGQENGEIFINIPEQSTDFASVLNPSQIGLEKFNIMRPDRIESVTVRRLDEFVIENGISGESWFLKMDTQGFDLQVFAGASGIRDKITYAMTELSIEPIYEGMPSYFEALTIFREGGFRPVGFSPVTRNPDLSLIEADCFLVNTGRR